MPFCKKVPGGFDSLQIHPRVALRPLEKLELLQCGPRVRWPARPAQFRRGRQPWPGGVGAGWSKGALGPVWEVGRGGHGAGGGVRWWQASAGTRAPAPASSRSCQENGRRTQLYGILVEAPGASAGSEGE
jgi:hypothetical protein